MRTVTLLVLFCFCRIAAAAPASVVFRDSVTVAGPDVSLGEIAAIFCANEKAKEKLASMVVSRHLAPHRSRMLSSAPIEAMLRRDAGVDLVFGNSGKIFVLADNVEVSGDSLRQKVSDYILRTMSWPIGDASIRITDSPERVYVRNSAFAFQFGHDPLWDFRGAGRVRVDIMQNQDIIRSFHVGVQVQIQHAVCVVKNPIKRNSRIRAEDIAMERVDISRMRYASFGDPADIIGREACRTMSRGRVIDATMVRMPPAIEAGAPVRIVIVCGSARVAAEGVSRTSGAIGDRIQVYCPMTRKVFRGQIQADKTVVIDSGRRKV